MGLKEKRTIRLVAVVFLILAVVLFPLSPASQSSINKPQPVMAQENVKGLTYPRFLTSEQIKDLNVKGAILIDYDTGQVLYGLNERGQLHPASITKLMTLYIVLEKIHNGEINWNDYVATSVKAATVEGSQVYLRQGESLTLEEMIKAMLVASANDAAIAIAEKIAGSEEAFVQIMNDRALELGLKDTHFINASGLPAHNINDNYHYMSAYDIAVLSKVLIDKYPEVLEFSKLKNSTVRNGSYAITNTNKILGYFEGMDGLKTGYTDRAGLCLTATAERNDVRLISVVLGAQTQEIRNASTVKLLSYGFNNYGKVESIYINGLEHKFSQSTLCVSGTLLVPLDEFAGILGIEVAGDKQRILVSKGDTQVVFNMGSRDAACNDESVQLPQPVQVVNGRVMVPLRFLSEVFGAEVQWDQSKKVINIFTEYNKVNSTFYDSPISSFISYYFEED